MRWWLLGFSGSALVVLIAVLPIAAAQSPTSSLTLSGAPTDVQRPTSDTQVVSMNAVLRIENVVCTTQTTFTATVTPTASAGNGSNASGGQITAKSLPPSLSFTAAAMVYGSGTPFPAYTSQPVAFTVTVEGRNLTAPVNVTTTVAAAFAGGNQCAGQGQIPPASNTASFVTAFGRTAKDETAAPGPRMPLPASLAFLAIVGALGLAAWRRRA